MSLRRAIQELRESLQEAEKLPDFLKRIGDQYRYHDGPLGNMPNLKNKQVTGDLEDFLEQVEERVVMMQQQLSDIQKLAAKGDEESANRVVALGHALHSELSATASYFERRAQALAKWLDIKG